MRGQLSVWFWLILTFVLVAVVGVILYVNAPPVVPVVLSNVSSVSLFSVFVSSNFPVNYSLSNASGFLVSGVLRDGVMDSVYDVPNGSLLNLSGWGSLYYLNSSVCNVSVMDVVCRVDVFFKASDFVVVLYPDYLSINFVSGVVQSPIVCFAWSFGVDNVLMDFPIVDVPLVLYRSVDACYQLPSVVTSESFPFDVHFNALYPYTPVNLSVFVLDYEVPGFGGIGLRNASIIVQNR